MNHVMIYLKSEIHYIRLTNQIVFEAHNIRGKAAGV